MVMAAENEGLPYRPLRRYSGYRPASLRA
jgi:hypothetical protein